MSNNVQDKLDSYDTALDFLIDAIDRSEIEVGEIRANGTRNKVISNEATKRLASLFDRVAAKQELYGRLHQVIEMFKASHISGDVYSELHSNITKRINALSATTTKEEQK